MCAPPMLTTEKYLASSGSIGSHCDAARKNGISTTGTITGILAIPASTVDETSVSTSAVYRLIPGDYVEVLAIQNSGGALNLNAGGGFDTSIRVTRQTSFAAPQNTVTLLCVGG